LVLLEKGDRVTQAEIEYRHNQEPQRGLAAAGIFGIKALLAMPHLLIISVLGNLAMLVGYIGYFVVAFTGRMPEAVGSFASLWIRWVARTYGWLASLTDRYPPFEPDPAAYEINVRIPRNDEPSQGWAVAGIFFVKLLATIPHLVALLLLTVASVVAAWIGYFVILFGGRYPAGWQDLVAGTMQWYARVWAWVLGLTDEYPPFSLATSPSE
jgi:hypothetical protein